MEEKLEVVDEERSYTVYMHTSPNDKRYIGITRYKPKVRWRNGDGYKNNTYFYRAIKKYGWDNFQHDILFEGLTKKEAEQKEIELIALLNTQNRMFGYNISAGGGGTVGVSHYGEENPFYNKHHNQSAKDKIREARSIAVCQYSKNGKLLNIYNSITEASISTGISAGNIASCCKKIKYHKSFGGYIWRYKDDILTEEELKICNVNGNGKIVYQYTLSGVLVRVWDSLAQIENELGYNHSTLSRVCRNKQEKAYGFIWRYADDE